MEYFSDVESGEVLRVENEISHAVWCGISSYIEGLIEKGAFGDSFPSYCADGQDCIGTDRKRFGSLLQLEIPEIEYPFVIEKPKDSDVWVGIIKEPFTPNYLDILDLIQFCYKNIASPIMGDYHSYYRHYHIQSFNREEGQIEFGKQIEMIFKRNNLAYKLLDNGNIERILNPELEALARQSFKTKDDDLNNLIYKANIKMKDPDAGVRYEALKDLFDAWERIKTVYNPDKDKKGSMKDLLESCAKDEQFRLELGMEAKSLTDMGNKFFIRHSEISQVKLTDSDHIEYLYHRLISFIYLLSKKVS